MNWDCDGFGRLWRCSALSLPLLPGNHDNKSSSKENPIGAKFLHAIGGVVDVIKHFQPCCMFDFT